MTTWRTIPLTIGHVYLVTATINRHQDNLRQGQELEFTSSDYSAYDNLTVMGFIEMETKKSLQVWWFDSEPDFPFGNLRDVGEKVSDSEARRVLAEITRRYVKDGDVMSSIIALIENKNLPSFPLKGILARLDEAGIGEFSSEDKKIVAKLVHHFM
jgi:hypothetical protein